jgi:hypothetical protein
MTAAIILAELDQLDRDRAALMARLRAALANDLRSGPDAPTVATAQPNDSIRAPRAPVIARRSNQPVATRRWELAAKAFRRFPLESHTVRRICSSHPEWAVKFTGGVWYVDADMFAEFAARVERGEASFAVSEKSALSVAEDAQIPLHYDQQQPGSETEGN